MNKRILITLSILITFILAINPSRLFAAFSLSVRPYEGGFDLKYGNLTAVSGRINKEATVSITSDIAKQYRLIQSLIEPLTNAQGDSIAQNNFLVYGIRGSNSSGTLNVEQEIPVSIGRYILYTSNQLGNADSFNLVYGLIVPAEQAPGAYRGRVSYTLEPIDATQTSATVIMNIFAEIASESKIEITTAAGSKIISLNAEREENKAYDLLVSIKGGFGSQFKILQAVAEPLISPEGNELPLEAINFSVKEAKKGTGITTPTSLSSGQQPIYTSGSRGEAEDFVITYNLAGVEKQKFGKYRGAVKYYLEGQNSFLIDTFALEVENERVFDLMVSPEIGGVIQFQNLKPKEPPRTNEVTIKVNSNLGKPYQVSQKTGTEFIDTEGNIIPAEYFTLKMEPLETKETKETKGRLKFPLKTAIKTGEMVLFVSDRDGSSDSFKIIYELGIPFNIKAGDYATTIVYSIAEI